MNWGVKMKNKLKSFLCCILAVIMVLSSGAVAFAKEDVTPVVSVHGMGGSGLYKNPNTDKEEAVAGFSIANLLGTGGLLSQLLAVSRGENVNTDKIISQISDFMSPYQDIALDKNGNTMQNIGIKNYWTDSLANHPGYIENASSNEPAICRQIADKIGAKNVFAFNYDWRLDACENAKKLNTFIDGVKKQTGKNKVTIVSGSEGTVVASAYIDAYKSKNDIERLVFVNGAFNGVNVTKAFKQDVVFDKEVIMAYLREICITYNNKDMDLTSLKLLVGILDTQIENLCSYLNDIASKPKKLNKVYNEVLKPLGTIPALWEFIPYNDFNACVNKMSSIGFLDKSSGLYKKISRYHKVQGRLQSNLKQLKNKGVEIAIIANYGTPAIPFTSAYNKQADILIDSDLQSVGATIANYGTQLDKSGKYISDDKIIDASTCLFPNNTWFVKGIQHMNFWYNTEATDFLAELVVTKADLNVKSIEKNTGTGQFIGTDKNQNIISVGKDNTLSFFSDIEKASSATNTKSIKKSPPTGNNICLPAIACAALAAATSLVFLLKPLKRKIK